MPDRTSHQQITWQTQSLSEPVNAVDFLLERGVELQRTGRDGAGSNWATYFSIGWPTPRAVSASSKSAGMASPSRLNIVARCARKCSSRSSPSSTSPGVAGDDVRQRGYDRGVPESTTSTAFSCRVVQIVKHGPVNLFVEDVNATRDFYIQMMGFEVRRRSSIAATVRLSQINTAHSLRCSHARCATRSG